MNIISSNQSLTMSSREIAELTGKRHDNVRRTIESLLDLSLISVTQSEEPTIGGGKPTKIYQVNEEDSYIVVARLSPEFTAKIVKRWRELESKSEPALPQTKREWIEFALEQEKKLELAAPKVAFVDNLVNRTALMNASQVAQKHKKSAIWLNKILTELNVYNKAVKRGKVFQQWFVDKGYGEMKQSEEGYSQAMFTNAGEVWVNEKLHTEGVV